MADLLIKEGQVKGKVQQGGVYIPSSFTLM